MSKSKRLMELMMTVNRKRKFTVKELANEFDVSTRTILRDLQELSELGVPLYSEVGPHGGYQVLKERILPPIAFTEEEAVAIFFASHALRHYTYLPFENEALSALNKFYFYMPGDVRDRIDQLKNRFDFFTPERQVKSPYLSILLEGAIEQKIVLIEYDSREGHSSRQIQPIGVYASNGLWYCSAYCFLRAEFRLFRCDRIHSAVYDASGLQPLDLRHVHLGNQDEFYQKEQEYIPLYVELSKEGVQRCESELWPSPKLYTHMDGTGRLEGHVRKIDLPFFAKFFVGLGNEATVKEPVELVDRMKRLLSEIMAKYV
ncbi:helix-turn-helix transcriptional regulator [Paenibacillus sp. PL91]|uniref:helix-turn-helix transcriptional regulator n=1 Tax=Paenibacillus sp. PL91 TaxID=2729538 RepID=UPI00145FAC58|nr:YafY family protein [Paenibacillus sp. PL91]MBC9203083.1 YafY family transcriptional regulator [Paenibacillus sp. PL91]